MRNVADKRQLNLYPDRSIVNRLEQIASTFGRPRTEIAIDILDKYMDLWVLAEKAKQNVIEEQHARYMELMKGGEKVRELPKAQTESVGTQGRKRTK